MKCHLCSNELKVRTDPQNCDYTMHQGLRKIRPESIVKEEVVKNPFEKIEKIRADTDYGKLEQPKVQKLILDN